MDFGLKGKNALVLASSGGLGRAVATALAAEGARVFVTGRSREKLDDCLAAIRSQGGVAQALQIDLGAAGAIEALHTAAVKAFDAVDVLVNNSGGPPPGAPSEIEPGVLERQFETMVLPLIDLTRRVLGDMRARRWGRVLTIVSSGVVEPIPNLPISNALRLSLVGWMKSLANEVAVDGVTVNLIAPGRIETDRVRQIDAAAASKEGRSVEDVRRESQNAIPARRYGTVEEFAAVAAFLASAPASYVTGSIVRADGGMLRSL